MAATLRPLATSWTRGKTKITGRSLFMSGVVLTLFPYRDTTGTGSFPGEPTESGRATSGVAYGDEPTSGYASQVTGGTGTTALAEGRSSQPIEHSGAGGTDSGTMPGVSQHSGGGFGSVENTSEERNQYSRGV